METAEGCEKFPAKGVTIRTYRTTSFCIFEKRGTIAPFCFSHTRMKLFTRLTSLFLALFAGIGIAHAAVTYKNFQLHDFDAAIAASLGYEGASVTYFKELGSITQSQYQTRLNYEKVGCYPFYIMKDGKAQESGYNCRTFFCAGYTKGPKVCEDSEGKSVGGVVEINKRMSLATINDGKKYFEDYTGKDLTPAMQERMAELTPLLCRPYYLMEFDFAVGEGFECEEVGKFPHFSNANDCVNDWRIGRGQVCDVPLRENEMEIRRRALGLPEASSSASSASGSSVSSGPPDGETGSGSSASSSSVTFSDVLSGQYGYTAIMDLAQKGIVSGYRDGTFKPKNIINRAEFSKMLMAGLHVKELRAESRCFPDVRAEWFAQFVCAAKRLRWIAGYPDGTFKASQTIKKAEALKIVMASLNVPLDSLAALPQGTADNQWYSPYVRKAVELGIILEGSFFPGADATRADAAVWMYRAAKIEM